MKKFIGSFLVLTLLIFGFQNCGDVRIGQQQPTVLESKAPVPHSIEIDLCLTANTSDQKMYDLQNSAFPLIVNLTALPFKSSYAGDSDMDGLSDSEESSPFLIDNPRSLSLIDSICFVTGTCPASCTDLAPVQIGLSRCDVLSYTNVNGYEWSYDSDRDGVPDYLEIIRRSDPIRSLQQISAADADSDQDNRDDIEEIRDQTDSTYNDSASATDFRPIVTKIYQATATCPVGTPHYRIKVPDQPFVEVEKFSDNNPYVFAEKTFSRTHDKDENVIMIYLPLVQTSNPQIHRALVGIFKMKDVRYSTGDFIQSYQLNQSQLEWTDKW